jgi:ketosteroid isomerase-like protein
MDRPGLERWLEGYVTAWESYDPAAIGALFSDDVIYRDYPYADPIVGRDAVVADWLGDRDAPGTYKGEYAPVAVEGDSAVAAGLSTYFNELGEIESLYHNVFVMRFDDDGRCTEWTEYYVRDPKYGT